VHAKAVFMTGDHANKYADEVRRLIELRVKIKGPTLERALARTGRLLPQWAQREGRYLAQASQMMDHPELRMMVDQTKLEKAHKALISHLKAIDPV